MVNYPKLIGAILLCLLAGFIGSFFTMSAIPTWYADLNKPGFNPPNWIFGPVWTILYILMGLSFYLIWNKRVTFSKKKTAYYLFFSQLTLNTLWSIIFFGLQNPTFALIEIVVLWVTIILTIFAFSKHSILASWLLIPYISWVSFASILNLFIVLLN